MKKAIIVFIAVASAAFISCNSNSADSKGKHAMMNDDKSMPMNGSESAAEAMKTVPVTFSHLDPGVSSYMKSMMKDYLGIKNALIDGDESGAASAAAEMHGVMKRFDKSLLTAEQKKVYDGIEDDLMEHAEHISEKNELDHKRTHFSMMSEDMYDMVKAYGAGMTIYHDHCPMYKNGSMWLSETKDIRNPYYGKKMMECGSVMEMFQ